MTRTNQNTRQEQGLKAHAKAQMQKARFPIGLRDSLKENANAWKEFFSENNFSHSEKIAFSLSLMDPRPPSMPMYRENIADAQQHADDFIALSEAFAKTNAIQNFLPHLQSFRRIIHQYQNNNQFRKTLQTQLQIFKLGASKIVGALVLGKNQKVGFEFERKTTIKDPQNSSPWEWSINMARRQNGNNGNPTQKQQEEIEKKTRRQAEDKAGELANAYQNQFENQHNNQKTSWNVASRAKDAVKKGHSLAWWTGVAGGSTLAGIAVLS